MEREVNGHDEYQTKCMLAVPITELSRLIGEKWYLPIETLSERSGVSVTIIRQALRGYRIRRCNEEKIRRVLERM